VIVFPIYLALGSNIGNREDHLKEAIKKLTGEAIIKVTNISDLYETEPKYYQNQTEFYNIAVEGQTNLTCTELLSACKKVESEMGRDFGQFRNGPRIIDIDIIFFGQMVFTTDTLTIPHPRMDERRFVLQPMLDLAPDFVHPLKNKSIAALYEKCPDNDQITKIKDIKFWISH